MRAFNKRRTTQGYLDFKICAEEYLNVYLFDLICKRGDGAAKFSTQDYLNFNLTSILIDEYNDAITEQKKEIIDSIEAFKNENPKLVDFFFKGYGNVLPPKVIIWDQREHTSYYIEKLQSSFLFELYIYKLFLEKGMDLKPYLTEEGQNTGENEKGVEIKNDMMYKQTQNVYIEYKEKTSAKNNLFVNSGILKNDNTKYFLIGDQDKFWIFNKVELLQIFKTEKQNFREKRPLSSGIHFVQKATSKGMLISINRANQITKTTDEVIRELYG